MEAFMYRHHPQWKLAKELVDSGKIGPLRTIQTFFSFFNDDPHNIRHDPSMGGGGLMDIGCYAISLSRWIMGGEPDRVSGLVEVHPEWGVDRTASAILDFGAKGSATFTCSMAVTPFQVVQIIGERGRIELSEVPFNAPPDQPCAVRLQPSDAPEERIEVAVCDQYTIQEGPVRAGDPRRHPRAHVDHRRCPQHGGHRGDPGGRARRVSGLSRDRSCRRVRRRKWT